MDKREEVAQLIEVCFRRVFIDVLEHSEYRTGTKIIRDMSLACANSILALDKTEKEYCECGFINDFGVQRCPKCFRIVKPSPTKLPEKLNYWFNEETKQKVLPSDTFKIIDAINAIIDFLRERNNG